MLYIACTFMRIPASMASLLLLCTLGSFLWCADACTGASGAGDEDCTCLVGGLLADHSQMPGREGHGSSSPAQTHESCRCSCQTLTLVVSPFVAAVPRPHMLVINEELTPLPFFPPKGILRPPRFS